MRKYDPLDPDAGLPKECVECDAQPVQIYTDLEGHKIVACDAHAPIGWRAQPPFLPPAGL